MSYHVQKTVAGKPMSIIGPFPSLERAAAFIKKAWEQEEILGYSIRRERGCSYRDICYSIVEA